jgi:hypothetical protein
MKREEAKKFQEAHSITISLFSLNGILRKHNFSFIQNLKRLQL